jgi:DNA-binding NarL/FixJ family response regulator
MQLLAGIRDRAHNYAAQYDEKLEDFVLRLLETGCSVRSLAEPLNMSPSTVQKWRRNADRRRAG